MKGMIKAPGDFMHIYLNLGKQPRMPSLGMSATLLLRTRNPGEGT